jgi:DNA gyrase/topoisomerase IV subunit A
MANLRELRGIIDNHQKLLSMISDKILPIKQSLMDDCKRMTEILEFSHRKKEEKKHEIPGDSQPIVR